MRSWTIRNTPRSPVTMPPPRRRGRWTASLEGGSIENGARHSDELPTVQADGTEAGHGFSGRCMLQDRVLRFPALPTCGSGNRAAGSDIHSDSTVRRRDDEPDDEVFLLPQLLA